MLLTRYNLRTLLALCFVGCSPAVWAQTPTVAPPAAESSETQPLPTDKPPSGRFLRVLRDDKRQPIALQTAIVRYVPASGEGDLVVELVGAVHVGDRAYYRQLNQQFDRFDAVLYELVAPQGTRIPKGGRRDSDNPLALIQMLTSQFLQLDSQTEQIDYTKKHFVHADLSPDEMANTIRARGDDGLTLTLSITADLLRQQNLQALDREQRTKEQEQSPQEPAFDPFAALVDPESGLKLKRSMAEQFDRMETTGGGLGPTLNTILVSDRNQAAMRVFQTELAKGKKRIAIFYGAAHLPDFERRLTSEFGLKRDGEQWLTAWDLKSPKQPAGLDGLFRLFFEQN